MTDGFLIVANPKQPHRMPQVTASGDTKATVLLLCLTLASLLPQRFIPSGPGPRSYPSGDDPTIVDGGGIVFPAKSSFQRILRFSDYEILAHSKSSVGHVREGRSFHPPWRMVSREYSPSWVDDLS